MSDQSFGETGLQDTAADLLDPYEKLVSIEVLGSEVSVPEKNRLLRCFQYLSINTVSYGDFCWNGECTNCQICYHPPIDCQKGRAHGGSASSPTRFVFRFIPISRTTDRNVCPTAL